MATIIKASELGKIAIFQTREHDRQKVMSMGEIGGMKLVHTLEHNTKTGGKSKARRGIRYGQRRRHTSSRNVQVLQSTPSN